MALNLELQKKNYARRETEENCNYIFLTVSKLQFYEQFL